jgi:hypothetical protein
LAIEDVKPYTEIGEDIVEEYVNFLKTYRTRLEADLDDIHAPYTADHPWFGPFNPKEWAVLGMVHQIVHRRQIEAIVERL